MMSDPTSTSGDFAPLKETVTLVMGPSLTNPEPLIATVAPGQTEPSTGVSGNPELGANVVTVTAAAAPTVTRAVSSVAALAAAGRSTGCVIATSSSRVAI